MSKKPLGLGNLIQQSVQNNVVNTSAQEVNNRNLGSRNISVRLDMERYEQLRTASYITGKSHKDIMIEGFDLWWKVHGQEKE